MLDRVGVLNTKMVQSEEIKKSIQQALVESSAIIDLSRLQELANQVPTSSELAHHIGRLQQDLDELFRAKENEKVKVMYWYSTFTKPYLNLNNLLRILKI